MLSSEEHKAVPRLDEINICAYCQSRCDPSPSRRGLRAWLIRLAIGFTVISFVSLAFIQTSLRRKTACEPLRSTSYQGQSLYSPFANGIRYKVETTSPEWWSSGLYLGEPNDNSEAAWNQLIHPNRVHGVRLSREEALRLDITESIRLPNDDFAVIPSVIHNLHCLRRTRQFLYADHYYPNQSEEWLKEEIHHNTHCLESIRQSLICQPDLAPLAYYWSGNPLHEMNANPAVKRECLDWEAISEQWRSRAYNHSDLIRD